MPDPSPGPTGRRDPDERAARVRFRRAVALMVMTLVVPGSAQLVAGNRDVGRIAMRIWMVLVVTGVVGVVTAALWHPFAFWAASNTLLLGVLRGSADGARASGGPSCSSTPGGSVSRSRSASSTAARSSASTACCASRSRGPCSSAPTSSGSSAT